MLSILGNSRVKLTLHTRVRRDGASFKSAKGESWQVTQKEQLAFGHLKDRFVEALILDNDVSDHSCEVPSSGWKGGNGDFLSCQEDSFHNINEIIWNQLQHENPLWKVYYNFF